VFDLSYVITLLALNIAIFLLEVGFGGGFVKLFAFTPALAWQQPWTFVTAAFLHAGIMHLFFNMFALLMFGPLLEFKLGSNKFLGLYLAGGILGNIGYMLTAADPSIPGLGASGAIYTILGAMAVFEPNMIVFVGFLPLPMYLAGVFWFVTEFAFLGAGDFIARGAHLAGLALGVAYAFYYKKKLEGKIRFIGGPF